MKQYLFILSIIVLLILSTFLAIRCGGDSSSGGGGTDAVPIGITITIPPGL